MPTNRKRLRPAVEIRIEAGQCIGCAICADVCASYALMMGSEDLLPTWTARRCSGCMICFRQCPTGAIEAIHPKKLSRIQAGEMCGRIQGTSPEKTSGGNSAS